MSDFLYLKYQWIASAASTRYQKNKAGIDLRPIPGIDTRPPLHDFRTIFQHSVHVQTVHYVAVACNEFKHRFLPRFLTNAYAYFATAFKKKKNHHGSCSCRSTVR